MVRSLICEGSGGFGVGTFHEMVRTNERTSDSTVDLSRKQWLAAVPFLHDVLLVTWISTLNSHYSSHLLFNFLLDVGQMKIN